MTFELLDRRGRPYASTRKGTLGGHRGTKIYGRLDCRAARRALLKPPGPSGGYAARRVFFATAADAVGAGYRPCAVCLPDAYRAWKLKSRRAG